MAVQVGIKDFTYFIFCFAVQFYWQGGGLFSVREGVREGGFELGDVENRVYPLELLWEPDCNGVHAQGAYYLKRSQVLLRQFPQRSGCVEELRFYIYMIANPEGWRWYLLAVHCFLVALLGLCDREFQLGVQWGGD